jgi:di/tricarboxylate transporter
MTWEILFIFILLAYSVFNFVSGKINADLTALSVFGTLLLVSMLFPNSSLPSLEATLGIFSHPAPLTIAGMFIVSAALEKTGLIDSVTAYFGKLTKLSYKKFLFVMIIGVAGASAFINNTPIVIVLLPVVLTLAKSMNIASSKLLIPLSYASILGGTCTLIGTSTNLLASGILTESGYKAIGMFELSAIGIPLLLAGTAFLVFFGNRLLPHRETLTAILSEEERKEFMAEVFVRPDSEFCGQKVSECGMTNHRQIRLIEIIRNGVALKGNPKDQVLEAGDRLLLACRPTTSILNNEKPTLELPEALKQNLEIIASTEGLVIEGIVSPHSQIIGKTIDEVNFRQQFRVVLLAVHRNGVNLRDSLNELRLKEGDTLLLMGSMSAVENLNNSDQIIVLDQQKSRSKMSPVKQLIALTTVVGIVLLAAFDVVPIVASVIFGVSLLLLTRCLKPIDAYKSVEWSILVIIFGMLALGQAMTTTDASGLIANFIANLGSIQFIPSHYQPYILLATIYLITWLFTEFLSNNAAVALMIPIAISLAINIGLDPRPFVIACCIAASASFSTPIGYQTNTYVWGAGGYKYLDFTKIGLPLNLICFLISIALIPSIWNF